MLHEIYKGLKISCGAKREQYHNAKKKQQEIFLLYTFFVLFILNFFLLLGIPIKKIENNTINSLTNLSHFILLYLMNN